MNELTDRNFWINYWESKKGIIFRVPENYPFLRVLEALVRSHSVKSLLEIGGFPGYYSVWARQKLGVEATLLDFVVHGKLLHRLEEANGLEPGTIRVWETDLFKAERERMFDLVMSNGLIEHFMDTGNIVSKHVSLLAPGGALLITLPNFRGLNGWFQRTFDPVNYAKHNIACMDIALLRGVCERSGLQDIDVRYTGGFMLWLENSEKQPWWVRVFMKTVWFPIKVLSRLVPVETKAFSPFIQITATRPAAGKKG